LGSSTACGILSAPGQAKVSLVARCYATLFIRFLALMQARDLRRINLCLFSDGEKQIRESALVILAGKIKGFHRIPVYSIRKKLGLPLSSNPAEKACDLCVSQRQKGRGIRSKDHG
jgi:hypothetical protein